MTSIEVANFFKAGVWDCAAPSNGVTCGAKEVSSVAKDLCLDKLSCELDPKTFFAADTTANSTANCTTFAVSAKCAAKSDFDPLTILALGFVAFVMLSLGATLEWEDFLTVVREKKRGILIGWFSQFGIMPLFAFILARAANFDAFTATGLILSGCAPGGSTSNLFTYWSKGDVALSITMSAMSTMCALFMFPLLNFLYIRLGLGVDDDVAIPFGNIVISLLVIAIPATLGITVRNKCGCMCRSIPIYVVLEKIGSALGALFLVAALVTGVSGNPELFNASEHPALFVFGFIFQPIGCLLGFSVALAAKMNHESRVAVSLETGVQNYTLVIAVLALSFTGCNRILALQFPLIASFWYVINSLWICAIFRFAPCCKGTGGRLAADSPTESEAEDILKAEDPASQQIAPALKVHTESDLAAEK
jgi:bile acid transporter